MVLFSHASVLTKSLKIIFPFPFRNPVSMEDLVTSSAISEQCITTTSDSSRNTTGNNSHSKDTMETTHLDVADSIFTEELEPITLEPHLLPPLPTRMKTGSQKGKTRKSGTTKPRLTSTPVKSQKATSSPRRAKGKADKVPIEVYTCVESSEIPLDFATYTSPVSAKGTRGLSNASPLKDIYNTIGCSRLGKKSDEKEKIKNKEEVPSSAELTKSKSGSAKKKNKSRAKQESSHIGASFNSTVIVDDEISFKSVGTAGTPKSRLDEPLKECEVRIRKVDSAESGILNPKIPSKEAASQSCDKSVGLRSTARRIVKHKIDDIAPTVVPRCSTPPPSPRTPLGDESPLSLSSYDEFDTSYDTPPEQDSSLEDYRPPRRIPTPKFDASRSCESEGPDMRGPVRRTRRARLDRRPRGATALKYPTSSSSEASPQGGTDLDSRALVASNRSIDTPGEESSHLELTRAAVDEDDPVYQDFIALLTTAECMLLKCKATEKKLRAMQKQTLQGNMQDAIDPFELYSMTLTPAMTSAEMHIQTVRGLRDIRKANKILKKQIRLLTKVHCQAEKVLSDTQKPVEDLGSSVMEKTLESYVPKKVCEFIHPKMVVTGLFGCIAIGILLYVYQF